MFDCLLLPPELYSIKPWPNMVLPVSTVTVHYVLEWKQV